MSVIAMDWDGTLLDSRFRHQKVLADVLKLNGIAVSLEALRDFIPFKAEGRTTAEYLGARFPGLGDPAGIAREWVARIELPEYLRLDEIYAESPDALRKLSGNYRLILVSARQDRAALVAQVSRFEVAHYFHHILCVQPGPETGKSKADALKAQPGCHPSGVVGDTEVDEVCARLIGSEFYAVSYGFRSADWWNRQGIFSFASLSAVCEAIQHPRRKVEFR